MRNTLKAWAISVATLLSPEVSFGEERASTLFGAKNTPSSHAPEPIGFYSKGCGAGLIAMPETGPSWQMMRLSRNRTWGHPEMIGFLQELSERAQQIGWGGLYIGDISQARGGPIKGGHRSHQIGLDADIWFLPPQHLKLTHPAREKISSISLRSADQKTVTKNWSQGHHNILRAAASDSRVDRIFVAAAIKLEICATAQPSDTPWLQKIRPAAGHNTHFHVRLKCPKGAQLCKTQYPTVAKLSNGGNGCDSTLNWWVTDYLHPKPSTGAPKPKPKARKPIALADLPVQCKNIISTP